NRARIPVADRVWRPPPRAQASQQRDCGRPPQHASSAHGGGSCSERRSEARSIEMGEHIERLAQLVAETQWADVPQQVQQHTKLVLLDTLGVILAGGGGPEGGQWAGGRVGPAGTVGTVLGRGGPPG